MRAYTVFQLRWHDTPADRPSAIQGTPPDKPTIEAVVAAIEEILSS
jgi:hypothetical protein